MKTHSSSCVLLLFALALGAGRLEADLLTYWDFNEDAGSTTAADSSGNGNIGNLSNFDFSADSDFDPAGGKFGGAIHFDGFDDYVNNTTGFQPNQDFTYSYFFKPDEPDYTVGHARDDHIYSNARPHFSFSRDNGGDGQLGMYFNIGGDSQVKSTTDDWSNTEWHHVAWTYDGTEVKLYVNGNLESSAAFSGPHTVQGDGRFNLGSNAGGNATAFDGFMDDLAIWDEALSAADIAFISENGVAAFLEAQNTDSDGDGLPDTFEQVIIDADPGDAIATLADVLPGDDFDNDGSTNEDEFNNNTDATEEDSDDDGLLDGVETNDGTFASADATGTDPNSPDTDGDSISDGDEVAGTSGFVTDPTKTDTDGDGFSDSHELAEGTDPTSSASKPTVSTRILFLGGQAGPTQGADPAVMTFLEERYGSQNVTYMQSSAAQSGDEDDFDVLILSSTFGSGTARGKFQDSSIPILNWEEALARNAGGEFAITSGRPKETEGDVNSITIKAEHPITAGFDVGQDVEFVEAGAEVWWSTGAQAPGAISLACDDDTESNGFLTIIDTGEELLNGNPAPGRRIMLGMTDATFNFITEDGMTLFGQSIDWLLGITQAVDRMPLDVSYDASAGTLSISWESQGGKLYNLRSETDPASAEPISWPIFEDNMDIEATPPENSVTFSLPADSTRYFVVEEFDAPPMRIFFDDFENGQGAWTTEILGDAGTNWELDTPSGVGPSGAFSGINAFGTNIDDSYTDNATTALRSPAIDLTAAGGATLNWAQSRDIETMFDSGVINILDAADDSFLVELESGIDGFLADWEIESSTIPAEALGKMIKIEFLFTADDFNGAPQAGWYIDDVEVTVP